MDDVVTPDVVKQARAKSVQEHIDERPIWPDGTVLPSAPMTSMQWLIWSLAAAGKFFEGFVVFMTGVALPLLSSEFNIGAAEHGVIGAASLFGIGFSTFFQRDRERRPLRLRNKRFGKKLAFDAVTGFRGVKPKLARQCRDGAGNATGVSDPARDGVARADRGADRLAEGLIGCRGQRDG